MLILIFSCILTTFAPFAHAQHEAIFSTEEGKYGEERSRGDLAATEARNKFELAVCQKSLEVFCSKQKSEGTETLQECRGRQLACHAMPTSVATRFISKYGKGSDSAHQIALPAIEQLLEAFQDFRFGGLQRRAMVDSVATFSRTTPKKAQTRLIQFISRFDAKRPPTLFVDFWGYFQQWYPQRPQFTYRADGTLDTITVAFRFCGMPLMFVNEPNFARDVFAQAIFTEEQLPELTTGDQYTFSCQRLETEWRNSKK